MSHRWLGFWLCGLVVLLMSGCSDTTKNLGDGYVLVLEGGGSDHIHKEGSTLSGVPYGVTRYDYDDDFIIVKQNPREFDDVIDPREFDYKHGRDTSYFWVISKANSGLWGPLDEREFIACRKRLGIPDELVLASAYE
ncbi:MAG TPA: hypothetical protein PLB89_18140 [Flavobacteriales bacterium]|nr:hypothetical protein [Flavobacteriales bacterium]